MHPIATALDLAVCVMRAFNLAIIVKQSLVKSAPARPSYHTFIPVVLFQRNWILSQHRGLDSKIVLKVCAETAA